VLPYELTWHAAAKSMSALDRSMGRALEVEPLGRSLSRWAQRAV